MNNIKRGWKTTLATVLVVVLIITTMGTAFARRGFSSSRSYSRPRSSYSFRSRSSSKSYSSKSTRGNSKSTRGNFSRSRSKSFSIGKSTSYKKYNKANNKSFWSTRTKKSSLSSKRKGFGGTSIFDKKRAIKIKEAKAAKAKKQLASYRNKFKKKSSKPVYTAKTIPPTVKYNPIFKRARVKSTDNYSTYKRKRTKFYETHHWHAPTYVYSSSPSFGMWDSMLMWMMLDNINNNNYAKMAYNHANDPGFQEWRKEAERMAKDNAELKAKLNAMDAKLSKMSGPVDSSYLPPDIPPTVALAPEVLAAAPKDKVVFRLATGGKKGNYFKAGNILKKVTKTIDVNPIITNGTGENLILFSKGEVDGFIGQLDVIEEYALTNLEAVEKMKSRWIVLYREALQLISSRKGGIDDIKDLDASCTIFVGPKDSGTAGTWKYIVRQNPKRYSQVRVAYAPYEKALKYVTHNPKAAMLYVAGLNSAFMKETDSIAKANKLKLIPVNDSSIAKATTLSGEPLYSYAKIAKSVYPNLQAGRFFGKNKIKTLTVPAVFVVSDAWVQKNGKEALDDLTAGVIAMQPVMANYVNR